MKQDLWNAIVQSGLLVALLVAVGGVFTALFRYGTAWLEAKTAAIKDEHVRNAMQQIEEAVFTAVSQTAQQEGDVLKAAAEGGKLSPDQATQLKTIAANRVRSFLTQDIIDLASAHVGDVNAWIESLIERTVRNGGTK